jgi:hypothetical protein
MKKLNLSWSLEQLSGLRMVVAGAADAQTEDEILLLRMSCEWRFEPHGNDLNAVTSSVRDHPNLGRGSRGCNLQLVSPQSGLSHL